MDSSFVSSGFNRHRSNNNYFAKGAFLVQVTFISKGTFSPGMTPLPDSIPVEFYYRYHCYSN